MLYTTHYLEEAEKLCDRIGIMDHGKILAEGTLDELKRMLGDGETWSPCAGAFDADAGAGHGWRLVRRAGRRLRGEADWCWPSPTAARAGAVDLLSRVLDSELPLDGVSIQPPSLNSLFLKLTGRELRD